MDDSPEINTGNIVQHWRKTSEEDYETMLSLFKAKSYTWSMFVGHICVEKLLKALYVSKHKKHAPYIHNLFRLAELCHIEMTEDQADWLDKITTFNLNARYDDYKREFYFLCTADFAEEWMGKIKAIRIWINQML